MDRLRRLWLLRVLEEASRGTPRCAVRSSAGRSVRRREGWTRWSGEVSEAALRCLPKDVLHAIAGSDGFEDGVDAPVDKKWGEKAVTDGFDGLDEDVQAPVQRKGVGLTVGSVAQAGEAKVVVEATAEKSTKKLKSLGTSGSLWGAPGGLWGPPGAPETF